MAWGTQLTVALLVAGGVIAGAGGTAAAYYLAHRDGNESLEVRDYSVELVPSASGPYQVYLPVPADSDGRTAPGLAMRTVEGAPRFRLVQTEHGPALSIAAEGPVKIVAQGPLPLRLTLEDLSSSFKQFRFWGYLAPTADGPVLLKLEARERTHTASWDQHVDAGEAVLLQQSLEPQGWQRLRATRLFDVAAGGGYADDWPTFALGATIASVAALYAPVGVVLAGALRRARGRPARDAFK